MGIVGVIPAAGYAVRLGPLPCSKEVLPVGGRPVMDFVVERMRLAGCPDVRIVTRPDKADVRARALELGATVVEGRPGSVAASIALGLGGVEHDDVVLLGFPDSIWEPEDGFVRLLAALGGPAEVALGCFRSRDLERSDVVVADETGHVHRVQVKPRRPASDVIWGCAAVRARAFATLREHTDPGHLFDRLARTGVVRAVRFGGEFVDIGTPEALERLEVPA